MTGSEKKQGPANELAATFASRLATPEQRQHAAEIGPSIIGPGTTDTTRRDRYTVEAGPEWKSRYRWGPSDMSTLAAMKTTSFAMIAATTGIHTDIIGPCRRTAKQLAWILMFREIKREAMQYVGQVNMLPKPEGIKRKTLPKVGVVAYSGSRDEKESEFRADLARTPSNYWIDPAYAASAGLKIDHDGSAASKAGVRLPEGTSMLVDAQGRGFFADLDLFQVLDANNGVPIELGDGASSTTVHAGRRTKLDAGINILRQIGVELCGMKEQSLEEHSLIQHGADRQWTGHKPTDEVVAAFTPDGAVWAFSNYASSVSFEQKIRHDGGYNPESVVEHFQANYLGG